MGKDSILSLIRYALVAVGAYLVGKNFLGQEIDDELWQGIMGAAFALGGAVWGWFDKTATLEQIQSGFRSAISFLGMMLVGSGIIKDEVLQSVIGGLPIILSFLYARTSSVKNSQIAKGEVKIADLQGVKPKEGITPDTTPVKTK
jgi:hypothetical protein